MTFLKRKIQDEKPKHHNRRVIADSAIAITTQSSLSALSSSSSSSSSSLSSSFAQANLSRSRCSEFGPFFYRKKFELKIITIPHPTLATRYHLLSQDNTRHNSWVTTTTTTTTTTQDKVVAASSSSTSLSNSASIIAPAPRSPIASTIEGGSSTGDTSFSDSGVLKLAITAHPNESEKLSDHFNNRAGGGGVGVSVSCGGQTPPTPTLGKTLLNTNANLLPITTATDTFNNLKNLVKIEKSSSNGSGGNIGSGSGTSIGNGLNSGNISINNSTGNGYRSKGINSNSIGGYHRSGHSTPLQNHNHNHNLNSRSGGVGNLGSNNVSGRIGGGSASAGGTAANGSSAHFSTGYTKNSAKIRQYDSEVSPRPRRTYQGDSSSSRYYTKNSDILGHTGQSNSSIGSGASSGNTGRNLNIDSGNDSLGGGRRTVGGGERGSYQQSTPSDGGYNRNLNANSSGSGGGGNYRPRYENPSVNGNANNATQQRPFGSSSSSSNNGGYSNYSKSYSSNSKRGENNENNVNSRQTAGHHQQQRDHEYGGSSSNYRDFDDSPSAAAPQRNRYISGGGGGGGNNNNSSASAGYSHTSINSTNSSNSTNSLERRYKPTQSDSGGNPSLPPSALRQGQGQGINENTSSSSSSSLYERIERGNYHEKRAYNSNSQRSTPPLRGGGVPNLGGGSSSSSSNAASNFINSSNTSSRGASPNNSSSPRRAAQPVSTTPPPTVGRWVPPSLRPQHGLTQSEKNDAVFRKVRGILNKLTPEKFQELSDELLKLDLNSIVILNGVILLIFEKALDEPKYSSMYAQLCKRLSEEAPSFEKEPNTLCTFLRLLIAICRDKFNNRLRRDEIADQENTAKNLQNHITGIENESDEEERRHLAKQRMLGNVKFIGELNKLDMLSKTVLHQCIMELMDKKKKRTSSAQEMCEDMECLAQLLKTCGKNLDSEQGKELMNQYFERLERRSKSTEYPPRIRFMLKDVIELRENNWVPRKVATTEGPVPIKQIRTDDDQMMRTPFAQQQRNRDMRNNDRDGDSWMNRFHLNLQPGFNDMFSGLSVTGASPLVSPFAPNNNNRSYNNNRDRNQNPNYNNRYNKHNNNNQNSGGGSGGGGGGSGGNGSGSGGHREHSGSGGGGGNQHMNRDRDHRDRDHRNNSDANAVGGGQMNANKELAPRFKRNLISTNQDAVENLQMRPAANSLLFKAASQNQKMPAMLPISTPPNASSSAAAPFMGMGMGNGSGNSKEHMTPNAQYPLLGTPNTSHLSNPTRPSSTPSAEYDLKHAQGNHLDVGGVEKGLKATSSSPNFSASLAASNGELHHGVDRNMGISKNSGSKEQQVAGGAQLMITKHGSIEKTTAANANANGNAASSKLKKDKAFNKEEVLKKTSAYIKEHFFYEEEEEEEEEAEEEKKVVEEIIHEEEEKSDDAPEKKADEKDNKQKDDEENNTKNGGYSGKMRELIDGFIELKVPEKCLKDVCINTVMEVLDRAEERYLERVVQFVMALRKELNMKPNILLEVFKQVVNKINERESLNPRIMTQVSMLLAKAVVVSGGGESGGGGGVALLKLSDIANYTDNGQHYPLFLLVLQQLHKSIGKDALAEKFNASKIDLLNSLPEVDRNKARLAEILDERNLAFLYPLLKVQAEMLKQLTADSNPSSFYKWIKANVDSKYYKEPGFVSAVMTVLLKFITNETSLAEGTDIKKHPDKPTIEKEELLLNKYCQILQTFFGQDMDLQLLAIYALQVFCYNENFPKGMLCRWFKYLYEASVIEEEAFIIWKEEISEKYPGKGDALFQVNGWLTWLQEAESEDDD